MNNTITEIKNTLEGINSRLTEAEERISDLEDKRVEITTAEQNKERGQIGIYPVMVLIRIDIISMNKRFIIDIDIY